jgi:hypothetical protein
MVASRGAEEQAGKLLGDGGFAHGRCSGEEVGMPGSSHLRPEERKDFRMSDDAFEAGVPRTAGSVRYQLGLSGEHGRSA